MIQANYFTRITDIGAAAIAKAAVQGGGVNITSFVVGDGGGSSYQPTADMTALKNQTWAGVITAYAASEDSPPIVRVTALLPADAGGFTIREMGILDEHGQLIAVANTPDMEKTTTDEGASSEMKLSIEFAVSNAKVLRFAIDPTVILATKEDVRAAADALNAAKVDKVKRTGSDTAYKVLSDNNYTDGDKEQVLKIAGLSNPNLIYNGHFPIWQRGDSFFIPNRNYTADRWTAQSTNGDIEGGIFRNANGMEIRGVAHAVRYVMEDSDFASITGKQVILSWSFNQTVSKETFVATIPIVFDKHIPPGILNWVKLELGAVATPLVPRLYGEELALCQRYYCTGYHDSSPLDKRYMRHRIHYPVEMRVAPNLLISELSGWNTNPTEPELYMVQTPDLRGATVVVVLVTVLDRDATQSFIFTADAEIY